MGEKGHREGTVVLVDFKAAGAKGHASLEVWNVAHGICMVESYGKNFEACGTAQRVPAQCAHAVSYGGAPIANEPRTNGNL